MRTLFGRFVRFTLTLGFALGLVGWQASAQVVDYTYPINNGTITIIRYVGPGGDVTIPSTIDGLQVTSLTDYAFFDRINVTTVTIPKSVTSIGWNTFSGCASLTAFAVDVFNPSYFSSVEGVMFDNARQRRSNIRRPEGEAIQFPMASSTSGDLPSLAAVA